MTVIDNSDGASSFLDLEPSSTSFHDDSEKIFGYDAFTGILKLNPKHFPKGDLEQIATLIESSPKKTAHVVLTVLRESHAVDGIREVFYFTPEEQIYAGEPGPDSSNIIARWPPTSQPIPERRGLVQRMRDKFEYYTGISI